MPAPLTSVKVRSRTRTVAAAALLGAFGLASASMLVSLFLVYSNPREVADRDFVVYWATGRQLATFRNPYDLAALSRLEHGAGLESKYSAGFMRNSPLALPLTYPLGFLSLHTAAVIVLLILATAYAASVHMLFGIWGCRDRLTKAVVYLFAPALVCLIWGQISVLVLLGLALFLRFHASHPFLAGASLWLCALKPHLLIPAGAVLVAWIVTTRSYRILAGVAAALLASAVATLMIDPQAWTEYSQMMGQSGYEEELIPALSALLRAWLTPNFLPLQFAPAAAACVWALVHFWRRRRNWNWREDGNLLLLVSLVAVPYAYLNDHVVVIPAIVFAVCRTSRQAAILTLALASSCLVIAFICRWSAAPLYWATIAAAPAWLIWYGFARRASLSLRS